MPRKGLTSAKWKSEQKKQTLVDKNST